MDVKKQEQVRLQIRSFKERFQQDISKITDIHLTPEFVLKDYILNKDVFQSDKMTAVEFARWVRYNNCEYQKKHVIDMCCGGGIQGIVALLSGAGYVTFVDSSREACQNTAENIRQYGLENRAEIIQSDLFSNVKEKADLIIANPPFFPGDPLADEPISRTMCFGEEKAKELYRIAKEYSPRMAVCHWDFAGHENDPESLGPRYSWKTERRLLQDTGYGLQSIAKDSTRYHFKVILLEDLR